MWVVSVYHSICRDGNCTFPFAACGDSGEVYKNPDIVTCKKCRRTKRWKKEHAAIHGGAEEKDRSK